MSTTHKIKLTLSILGIGNALYLTYARITSNPLICKLGDCGKVQASQFAMFLGIPVAYWGLAYYFVLFILIYKNSKYTIYWCLWGFLFSMYLLGLELFVIHALCMWCMLSFFIIISISISELRIKLKNK